MNTFKDKIFKCINYNIKYLNKFKDILLKLIHVKIKYLNVLITRLNS